MKFDDIAKAPLETGGDKTPETPRKGVSFDQLASIPSENLSKGNAGVMGYGDLSNLQGMTSGADPNAVRAANQGFMAELGNSLTQFAAETLGSAITTATYFPGANWLINLAAGSEQQFGNILADYVNKKNQELKANFPVYNNPETKDVSEWLFENLPSLGSSVGLLVPILGEAKALGFLAKTIGGSKLISAMSGAAKGSEAFNQITNTLGAATAAGLSRHAENLMEGTEAGNKAYEDAISKGFSLEYAEKVKLKAAQETYMANWPLVGLDMLQFSVAFKSFKNLSRLNNELEKKALTSSKIGNLTKVLGGEVAPESLEEQYQYVTSAEAVRNAKLKYGITKDDYSTMSERLWDYISGENSDQFWTSAFMGALGGGVFAGIANQKDVSQQAKVKANQEVVKSIVAQQAAVFEKDPIKFREATELDILKQVINGVTNRRADDIRSLYNTMKQTTQIEGHTDEEIKELHAKADFGLQELDKVSELYDRVASKNTPDITNYILANRANDSILSRSSEQYAQLHTQELLKLQSQHNLDASYSKLLEAETSIKTLEELQKIPDFKIEKSVFDNKLSQLREISKVMRDTIKTNEKISDKEIDAKFEKVDKSNFSSINLVKNLTEIKKDQNNLDLTKVNTEKGKKEINKKMEETKEKLKDTELSSIVEQITPDKETKDLQKLKEQAQALGKEKEFTSAYNKKVAELKLGAIKFDPSDISHSLKERYKNNSLLRNHELNNISKIALQAGGLSETDAITEDSLQNLANNNPVFKSKLIEYFKNSNGLVTTQKSVSKEPTTSSNTNEEQNAKKAKEAIDNELKPNNSPAWLSQGIQFEYINTNAQVPLINGKQRVFVYGTLMNNDTLLEAVGRKSIESPIQLSATVEGMHKRFLGTYPDIEQGGVVKGSIVELEPSEIQKLDNWEAKYDRQVVTVNLNGQQVQAFVFNKKGTQGVPTRGFFDTSKPNQSNLTSKIDWEYLNSGSIPIGATLEYEYDYDDAFNKGKNSNNALFEIVHYDENGKRHIVGALSAYNEKKNYESQEDAAKLKNLREKLWNNLQGKAKFGIVGLDIQTRLKRYLSNNYWNTSQYNAPLDVLKPDEELILAVAKLENGIPYLDFNGHKIKDRVEPFAINPLTGELAGTAGAVYMIIKNPATGLYVKYKLFTQPVSSKPELQEYITNEIQELERNNQAKGKDIIEKIGDLVYIQDLTYHDGTYSLTIGSVKLPSVVTVKSEGLKDVIGSLIIQVDSSKINKEFEGESYNKWLSKQGYISTNLNPNQHFHSTNFVIEPYNEATFVKDETKREGKTLPTPKDTSSAELAPAKIIGVGTTKLNLEEPKYSLSQEEEQFEPLDLEKTKQWFIKNLPQVPVEVVENLIEVRKYERAWGQFKDSAITLYRGAPTGTDYHEAFHAVFHLFLNEKQRENIFNEVNNTEEYLANKFAQYVENEGKEDSDLGYNVRDFFRKLWEFIKSIFTNNVNIDSLFFRINTGFYKNKPLPNNYQGTNYSIAGTNPLETKRRVDMINYQFFQALDEVRNEYSLGDLSTIELLKKINPNPKDSIQTIYERVFNGLVEAYNLNPTPKLRNVIDNFFVIKEGVVSGFGDYYGLAIQDLSNFGIKIKENYEDTEELSEEEEQNFEFNEEELKQSSIPLKSQLINPKSSIGTEVKIVLRQLERYKYNSETKEFNQDNTTDDLGFKSFVNYDEITNYLQRNIANIYDVDDMMNKLEELKIHRPEIYGLLNKLNENNKLKTLFYNTFSKAYIPYHVVYKFSTTDSVSVNDYGQPLNETRFKVIPLNKNGIAQLKTAEWNGNLLTPFRNEVTNPDTTINVEKAKQWLSEYQQVLDKIRKFKEIDQEGANRISEILNKFGITITPKVFINEFIASKVYENGKKVEFSAYETLMRFLAGNQSINTIISKIASGDNPYQGDQQESAAIRKIAGITARTEENLHQDTIYDSEGNQLYSYISPTFLHKKVQELKSEQGRKLYNENWWFQSNKWLQELNNPENGELRDIFDVIIANGYLREGGYFDSYSSLTPKELAIFDINLYDLGGDKVIGLYRTPIITGSSMAPAIKFKKYSKNDVIDALYQLALAEKQRIENLVSLDIDVKNLSKNGKEYQFVDIFNSKPDAINNINTAKDAIQSWMNSHQIEEQTRLQKEGILDERGIFNNTIDSRSHQSNFKDFKNKFEEYFYNVTLAKAMILQLTSVDISYYSNANDFQKRAGQIFKPTVTINPKATYKDTVIGETYNAVYLIDEEEGNSNTTDSETYISIDRRRNIDIGRGLWNDNKEKVYTQMKKGKAQDDSGVFSPLKPFYFNHQTLGNWILPTQIKNSEITLTNNFTKKNPKLEAVRKRMDERGDDTAIYVSAVKAGQYGAVSVADYVSGKKEPITHIFQNKYYGIQTEIPNHYLETEVLFGTQVKKLIMADIEEDARFFNNKYSKKELYDLYQKLLTDNIVESYNDVAKEFADINKIQRILLDEVNDRNLGPAYRKALEIKTDYNGNKVFNLPLFDPMFGSRMQNILNSIIRNNVTKQKINGGSFVLASSYGIVKPKTSDELKIVRNKETGAIEHMEVMLPAWMKNLFPRLPNGEVDLSAINEEAPDILKGFGYFIPTEGPNSTMALNVVGFVPDIEGGIALFPGELIAISGKDFDKDEVYIMLPNVEVKDGKLQKVKYDLNAETLNKKQRDNAIIDIMREVWSHPSKASQIEKHSNFKTLISLRDEINERLGVNMNMNPIFPQSDASFFERSTNGGVLLPIAAVNNSAHANFQYSKLKFTSPLMFDGESAQDLNLIETLDGKSLVSSDIVEFLAAFADNDKNPVAGYLNLNDFTINTVMAINSVGFRLPTSIYFVNQPVIRKFTEEYYRNGATLAASAKAYKGIREKLVKFIGEDIAFNSSYSLRTNELKNNIRSDINAISKDEAIEQLKVLYSFMQYKEMADALSLVVRATRADTIGTAKTMADNNLYLDLMTKAKSSLYLENVDTVFDIPLIKVSTEKGIVQPQRDLLSKYLPYDGQLFKDIIGKASLNKGSQLTNKETNFLYNQFIHYYVSGFDFFKKEEKEKFIDKFPEHFGKLKNDPKFVGFELMKYLRYVPITAENKIPRIEFISGTAVSNEQRDNLRLSWEAMLASDNTEVSKMAINLIKYSYFTTNFGFLYSGFSHLIPANYLETIQDSDGLLYRDYLYKMMEEAKSTNKSNSFLQQVYQNYGLKIANRLLPTFQFRQITNSTKRKGNVTPSIMFNKKTALDNKLIDAENKPLHQYIRVPNTKQVYTYKYSGLTQAGDLIYNVLPNLGYENHIVEFDYNNKNIESSLTINKLGQFSEADYYKPVQDDETYQQLENENNKKLEKANAELNSVLKQWLSALGVKIEYHNDLQQRLGVSANAMADIYGKLVLIAQGKENISTLPEEVGHFAEAYMRNSPLHETLMTLVASTPTYKEVVKEYGAIYFSDETKLKREAIGKLIGDAIIRRNEDTKKTTNNIVLQFLDGLWKKFISIFKRADSNDLIQQVNSITDFIAKEVLEGNVDSFKAPTQLKLGDKFYQLTDDVDITTSEKVLEDALDSINKKIKLYSEKSSEAYASREAGLLDKLKKDFAQKSYEIGLLRYVANARIELKDIAKRYNSINQSSPETVEDMRELLNQLKAASNYTSGFRDTLEEIAKLAPFAKSVNAKAAETASITEKLHDDYIRLGKALLVKVLKQYSSNPGLDIKGAINILEQDISFFQRWFDAMAETSDPILGILDNLVKDSKEVSRRKILDINKEMIDAQLALEKAGVPSTSFYAERDFSGKVTGYRLSEYNRGEYEKQKRMFFELNQKPKQKDYTNPKDFVKATKDWYIKVAQWFETNTQPHPNREQIIKDKKEEFNKEYKNPKVAQEKYNEWLSQNIREVYGVDEYGTTIETSYRGELQIPAKQYLSKQYEEMLKNPALKAYNDKVEKLLNDLDELLPEKYKLNGLLPQVRKDFYDRMFFIDEKGKKKLRSPKDIAKEARITINEAFKRHENDIEFGLTDENNIPVNFIPVFFTRRLSDMNQMSLDITSTIVAFASSVHDFNAMSQVLGTMEVAKDVLAERAVLTGKFDPVTLTSKLKKMVKGEEIPVKPITIEGDESRAYHRLDDYIKMVLFGQRRNTEIVAGIDVAKVIDQINRYTALNSLAGNIYSGISNITFGTAMERIEAVAGEFYDNKDLFNADKEYTKGLGNVLADIGKKQTESKINLWEEIHNSLQSYNREFRDNDAGRSAFARLFRESSLFFINQAGEHYMQIRSSIALAHQIKLKDKEGNTISYWDAWEKVNVGTKENPSYRLQLKEGLTKVGNDNYNSLFKKSEDGKPLTDRDVRRFINRQNFINKRLHGIYNDIDVSAVQKYALGRMAIMFRKYIKPGWNRRFAKLTYNEEGEIYTEGNYYTMFRFIKLLVSDLKKLEFSFIKNYKNLNPSEKANVMRTLVEATYMIAAVTLGGILTQLADDDEDNWALNLAAYESYRLYSEMRFYTSATELWRLLRSPAAAIYQFNKINKFLSFWDWSDEVKRGKYKGLSKFEVRLIEIAPLVGTYYNFKTPEEQLRYYTSNGVTIF